MEVGGPSPHPPPDPGSVRKKDAASVAAQQFEAEFLAQAVEEMLGTIPAGSFGGGHGEELWRSFLARAYADELAARGTTGLAASVESAIAAYRRGGA